MRPPKLALGDFFEGPAGPLFGVADDPPEGFEGAPVGVVTVAPFMEERQDTHELYRALGRHLAGRGVPTFRFDLRGTGDAHGAWDEATVEGWLDDIARAVSLHRERTGVREIALLGLRFGALLAAAAATRVGAARLALVQPVLKGSAYLMDVLRAHLAAEMVLHKRAGVTREALVETLQSGRAVNLFGYRLTPAQYRGIQPLDLAAALDGFDGQSLVVDVVRTEQARGSKELEALKAHPSGRVTVARAVEAQTLYVEGKLRNVQSENLARLLDTFFGVTS
ncbi:MAG: alpha/beta hydrolase [Myxococcales bacterium]|nr:alpha/beta hydrolase [Myxococcales bacterium]